MLNPPSCPFVFDSSMAVNLPYDLIVLNVLPALVMTRELMGHYVVITNRLANVYLFLLSAGYCRICLVITVLDRSRLTAH